MGFGFTKKQRPSKNRGTYSDGQSSTELSDLPGEFRKHLNTDDISFLEVDESVTSPPPMKSFTPALLNGLNMPCFDEECRLQQSEISNQSRLVTPCSETISDTSFCTFQTKGSHPFNACKSTLPRANAQKPHLLITNMVYLSLIADYSEPTLAAFPDSLPSLSPGRLVRDTLLREVDMAYPKHSVVNRKRSQPVDVDNIAFVDNSVMTVNEVTEHHIQNRNYPGAIEVYKTLLKSQASQTMGLQSAVAMTVSGLAALYLYKGIARRALQCIEEAESLQKEHALTEGVSISLAEKGLILFALNDLDKAMSAWRESLQTICKVRGYDDAHVPLLLNNMACVHFLKGQLVEAVATFEESLQLQRNAIHMGTNECDADTSLLQTGTSLCNIGSVLAYRQDYQSAIAVMEEGLLVQESVQEDTPLSKTTASHLTILIRLKEDSTKKCLPAEKEHLHVVKTLGRERTFFGDNDGIPMCQMNDTIVDRSDFIQLGPLKAELNSMERVRAVVLDEFGELTMSVAGVTVSMSIPVDIDDDNVLDAELHLQDIFKQATKHMKNNELEEAIDLFESSLHSHIEKYGEIHHLVGTMLHNMGIVHLYAESYTLALQYFKKATNVRTAALGSNHPDVAASLMKLSMVQIAMHDLDGAHVILLQLLYTQRRKLGYSHPQVCKTLNNIACVHYQFGGLLAALKGFEEALEIQRTLSKDRTDESSLLTLSYIISNIAFIHVRRKDYDDAILLFQEALNIQRSVLCLDHPSIELTTQNLAYAVQVSSPDSPVSRAIRQVAELYTNALRCGP